MRRRLIAAGLAVAVASASVAATATAALAGSPTGSVPVNCQADVLTGTAVSTSSTTYVPILSLSNSVAAYGLISVTVSADVSGAPTAFEMQDTTGVGDLPAAPGPAFVRPPGGAPTSFSFTWVAPNPEAGNTLTLVWKRNAASGTSTLLGGDVVTTYNTGPHVCPTSADVW